MNERLELVVDESAVTSLVRELRDDHGPGSVSARAAGEEEARSMLNTSAGRMNAEQAVAFGRALNRAEKLGQPRFDRFSPAFAGRTIQQLLEDIDIFNDLTYQLWRKPESEALELAGRMFLDRKILPGAGRSWPSALLYLRDPQRFSVWTRGLHRGLNALTGVKDPLRKGGLDTYLEYCDQTQALRTRFDLEPQEVDLLLWASVGRFAKPAGKKASDEGQDLPAEAFSFLNELAANNNREWFNANRDRYRRDLKRPFKALLEEIVKDYISGLDPELETEVKVGRVLGAIRKRWPDEAGEYHTFYWGAFSRTRKQEDVQLAVSVHADQIRFGVFLGSATPEQRDRLRSSVETDGEAILEHLKPYKDLLVFETDERAREAVDIQSRADLITVLDGPDPFIFGVLDKSDPRATSSGLSDLIGHVLTTLHQLAALAWGDQPSFGEKLDEAGDEYPLDQLAAETNLSIDVVEEWVELLKGTKRQALLYGPPGTGKTFVAERLAKHLASPEGEVLTVQFHPSFSYEDFIEGLRPAVRDGHTAFEVSPGVFRSFCDRARGRDSTHVFVIDEINRADLGSVLGELMMLLEYRGKTVELPYSKERFSIPRNVVVIATMNTADRSLALVDFALRRRFHAVQLLPQRDVLERVWANLEDDAQLALELFDLVQKFVDSKDYSPGHSYWLGNDLSARSLDRVWRYELKPYLAEYWFENPGRLLELDAAVNELLAEEA